MYCPKCGQQQISPTVRYCTRCGFALSGVSQLLALEGKPEASDGQGLGQLLSVRKKDLNVGATLMYLGTLFSLFVSVFYGGAHQGDSVGAMFAGFSALLWGLSTEAVVFAALLIGFRFSSRQRDLSVGATLMFLLGIMAIVPVPAVLDQFENVASTGWTQLAASTVFFGVLLLFSQQIMQSLLRGIFNFFADEPSTTQPTLSPTTANALPPAHSVAVEPELAKGATTAELAVSSVTEDATQLLGKNH